MPDSCQRIQPIQAFSPSNMFLRQNQFDSNQHIFFHPRRNIPVHSFCWSGQPWHHKSAYATTMRQYAIKSVLTNDITQPKCLCLYTLLNKTSASGSLMESYMGFLIKTYKCAVLGTTGSMDVEGRISELSAVSAAQRSFVVSFRR